MARIRSGWVGVPIACAEQSLGLSDDGGLRSRVSEPSAALARRAQHEVAEVGTKAVRAAEELAIMENAQPEIALDIDDEEVVETARLSEPVLRERDQIHVAVDRGGDAEPPTKIGAERHVALLQDRALAADSGRAFNHAGQSDADPGDRRHFEASVGYAAAHPVFHQVGDDGRGLAVDADREFKRRGDVPAKVGDRDRDLVRGELDADDMCGVGVELKHHPRAAPSGVPQGADVERNDKAIIEQRRSDRRDGGGAEIGEFGDFDPRHWAKTPDRVHHVEPINRAHQFGIGGLHRGATLTFCTGILFGCEINSTQPDPCQSCRLRKIS